jgi:enoyl-CoA hydratase/3-hydroxyacyl-CoA dehydrogenase
MTGKGGKFSRGFDISSFSDVQDGQSMIYFSSQFLHDHSLSYLILFLAVMQPKVGYIAIDILIDAVEGI